MDTVWFAHQNMLPPVSWLSRCFSIQKMKNGESWNLSSPCHLISQACFNKKNTSLGFKQTLDGDARAKGDINRAKILQVRVSTCHFLSDQ